MVLDLDNLCPMKEMEGLKKQEKNEKQKKMNKER